MCLRWMFGLVGSDIDAGLSIDVVSGLCKKIARRSFRSPCYLFCGVYALVRMISVL